MAEKTEFHGVSRLLMVDGLVAVYDGILQDAEPCLVSLEAPSGWGKTRIGREFYARLAAHRQRGDLKYWPDEILEADEGREVERPASRRQRRRDPMLLELHARRKAVRPALFERAGGSVPEFFWWGIACSERNGTPTSNLREDLRQVADHSEGLDEALRRLSSLRQRMVSRTKQAVGVTADEGFQEVVSKGVEIAAEALVPMVGVGLRLARMGIEAGKERKRKNREIAEASVPGASGDTDTVEACVALLGEMCGAGLPIVVLVEDIHLSDDMLLRLLDRLLSLEGPVLVITTTWPDMTDTDSGLSGLFEQHSNRVLRVGHTSEAGAPFRAGAGLMALDGKSRLAIVRGCCPQLAADTLEALADRYENPLAIELACQLLNLRHSIEELPNVRPEYVAKLPVEIHELYEDMWKQIPRETRVALAVAHAITPASIVAVPDREQRRTADCGRGEPSSQWAAGDRCWTQPVLHDVIKRLGLRGGDEILEDLVEAPHAYSWVRIIDDYLRSFTEDVQSEIAHSKGLALLQDELADNARLQILEALAAALIDEHGQHPDTANRSRTILVLHAEGYLADPQTIALAIDNLLRDHIPASERRERDRIYQQFLSLDHNRVSRETQLSIRRSGNILLRDRYYTTSERHALRHSPAHESDDASSVRVSLVSVIEAEEALLQDQLDLYGASHEEVIQTRQRIASLLRAESPLGDYENHVVPAWKSLVNALLKARDPQNYECLQARMMLCQVLRTAGYSADEPYSLFEEAAAESQALLDDWSRAHGPEDRGLRGLRHDLAVSLEQLGRFKDAAEVYAEAWGGNSLEAIRARYGRADVLKNEGRVEDAIAIYKVRHEDERLALGTDCSYAARVTQHQVVRLLGASGRFDEAITEFEALMNDCLRTIAPYRDGISSGVSLYGDATAMQRLKREGDLDVGNRVIGDACVTLLSDRLQVHGRDARVLASFWLQCGSQLRSRASERLDEEAEAATVFETMFNYRLESLGVDDPETLAAKRGVAFCLGMAGRADEAVTVYRELLEHRRERHDSSHPDVHATLHSLARWLGMAGHADEAVTVHRELLDRRRDLYDSSHPDILATLHSLAGCLNTTEHREYAVIAGRELLIARWGALGKDHPDTLDARNNLAACLFRADRESEAVEQAGALLEAQERLLGPRHDYTELTRRFVALEEH